MPFETQSPIIPSSVDRTAHTRCSCMAPAVTACHSAACNLLAQVSRRTTRNRWPTRHTTNTSWPGVLVWLRLLAGAKLEIIRFLALRRFARASATRPRFLVQFWAAGEARLPSESLLKERWCGRRLEEQLGQRMWPDCFPSPRATRDSEMARSRSGRWHVSIGGHRARTLHRVCSRPGPLPLYAPTHSQALRSHALEGGDDYD